VELVALPPMAAEQAALLVGGRGTTISHHSAAALWGLVEPRRGPVAITVTGSVAGRGRDWIRCHRTRAIDRRDVRRRAGLRLTAPARTLIDLAAESTRRQTELALDRAIAARLTSRTAIGEAVARCPRRAGVALVRSLLDPERGSTVTASRPEELLLALVRRARLPEPEVDVALGDPRSSEQIERYRPDLLWREPKVVVEFDSWLHHSGQRAFRSDRRRDVEMRIAGWTVIRITWADLTEEPERVIAWIATALARGSVRAA
jgi:very-short-patch-repair endonuclease